MGGGGAVMRCTIPGCYCTEPLGRMAPWKRVISPYSITVVLPTVASCPAEKSAILKADRANPILILLQNENRMETK